MNPHTKAFDAAAAKQHATEIHYPSLRSCHLQANYPSTIVKLDPSYPRRNARTPSCRSEAADSRRGRSSAPHGKQRRKRRLRGVVQRGAGTPAEAARPHLPGDAPVLSEAPAQGRALGRARWQPTAGAGGAARAVHDGDDEPRLAPVGRSWRVWCAFSVRRRRQTMTRVT